MKYCMLPFGNPYYYDGEYKPDEFYPLYIQCLQCCFSLKKDTTQHTVEEQFQVFQYRVH